MDSRWDRDSLEALFSADAYFRCPPLTDAMVEHAESALGRRLPRSYVDLLRLRNGGALVRRCVPTPYPTSWAPDHIEMSALLGIGGERGIDAPFGSEYLIREWGYPAIGIVIAEMPSGGHDAVMLDYRAGGQEPAVVYVDEDRIPRPLAPSFADLIAALRDCRELVAD